MQIILISGLSGSGKSVALKALEDAGFYCVDNLPASLLPDLLNFLKRERRVAVSVDVRSGETVAELPRVVNELRERGFDLRVIFLEANTESLVKRFSETRRPHPLSDDSRTLGEAIALERATLSDIAQIAHHIDTSDLRPSTLRQWMRELISLDRSRFTLYFQSFGYKHGIPLDADLVFDMRCLPNPFYDPALKPLCGKDQPVIDYLEAEADVHRMLADITRFIEDWIPAYLRDNRRSLTVALGCTGGQHRSVYFAQTLADRFRSEYQVLVRHRELPT